MALRQLSAARHVGKIVVSDQHSLGSAPAKAGASSLWLVSGGVGALGTLSARYLVEQGARKLCLLGRAGYTEHSWKEPIVPVADPMAVLRQATSSGRWAAAITITKCDVASREDADGVFEDMCAARLKLQGILHAGGLLQDATIANQSLRGMHHSGCPRPLFTFF